MERSSLPWSIKQITKMINDEKINFNHPVQRKGSQWSDYQKSLFIHSLLTGFPVPPVYFTKQENIYFVLDGKQRLTTVIDFMNDRFCLHEDIPNFEENDFTGMYFSELHEDVRSDLLTTNLTIQKLSDCTDDDLEEVFYRLNHGTPLSSIQKVKARMGSEIANALSDLSRHEFLTSLVKFTKSQLRKEDDLKIIIQSLMVGYDKETIKKFTVSEVCKYAETLKENSLTLDRLESIKATFDYLLLAIETKEKTLFKPVHLPMLITTALNAMKAGATSFEFSQWFNSFSEKVKEKQTPYLNGCYDGTTSKEKVNIRIDEMQKDFSNFVEAI